MHTSATSVVAHYDFPRREKRKSANVNIMFGRARAALDQSPRGVGRLYSRAASINRASRDINKARRARIRVPRITGRLNRMPREQFEIVTQVRRNVDPT